MAVNFLPGICRHGLAAATFSWDKQRMQETRLKQTAAYAHGPEIGMPKVDVSRNWALVRDHVNATEPIRGDETLLQAWPLLALGSARATHEGSLPQRRACSLGLYSSVPNSMPLHL